MRQKRKKSKKELKAEGKNNFTADFQARKINTLSSPVPKIKIELTQVVAVRDFAEKLQIPVEKVITTLIKNGVMASINDSIDFETAQIIGDELNFEIESTKKEKKVKIITKQDKPRPPVVVVMGHVDHGKTKLLDAIRKTDQVSLESGGITQHIGAYNVLVEHQGEKRSITFLDTPGHEAFSSMRAHGANITDIAVIVIAADDGIKPQTIEAINHAKNAKVPIIIAINKIDLPDADTEKVNRQLAEINLLPESWGGKIPVVELSAKSNVNISGLLEMILLVADMEGYMANSGADTEGVVIESNILRGLGPVATILIMQGTLKKQSIVTIGKTWAKIKNIVDARGNKLDKVLPGFPAQISGLKALPETGEIVKYAPDEKSARQVVKEFKNVTNVKSIVDESRESIEMPTARIIVKADVAGSLSAITSKIIEMGKNKVKVEIIAKSVGNISESDVSLASVSQSMLVGFKSNVSSDIKKLANTKNVKINSFEVIYDLLDAVKEYLEGFLAPIITEKNFGTMKVLKIFHQFQTQATLGASAMSGKIIKDSDANVIRVDKKIGRVKISNLELDQKVIATISKGQTFGAKITKKPPFAKIKVGDIIELYSIKKETQKL
ncbi:translation initiation factor IF-2 [Candidatus Berkelbacteria bacterium CG_4_9_14_3_um_filter_39_23]|uniref:Translation initiation factor IF-2 n=2 Tax=Candidatus Berkelbacteria TaxID=1618330 RepID=A0A2M7CIE9_9BACT|nr:MAG: translation initiation factor IF-2 [Candidatus Berkelbacteria bacterium CG11_big_fil_rev_8_21_14_0_20_40_23]PIV25417.1 MAG: translation initiation factor IF-2 [Candidatus Berkelbacteria bacterium CG03_land_8_20_14_0_80_40_36]PJB50897.1 MAG: translation initiation factor IF-2 [Candidatus Berkelbacteria bacterium CG_4_9_14_3_um_filter_39_23]